MRSFRSILAATSTLFVLVLAAGCARPRLDPLEPINRSAFALDAFTQRRITGSIASGVDWATPEPLRQGAANFLENASTPKILVNDLLQGRFAEGAVDLGRFAINTSFGIAGLFDAAEPMGLAANQNDFGRTLCVWGVPFGPYVYFPMLGPSSAQEAVSATLDFAAAPGDVVFSFFARRSPRHQQLDAIAAAHAAGAGDTLDFYTYQRLAYQQDRMREVRGEAAFVAELSEPIAGPGRRSCTPPWTRVAPTRP